MAGYRLTKEQMKAEIKKCGRDPVYFIKNYCKIQHPIRGLIPFTLYDFQEDLLEEFNAYNHNIILKARQLGISTLTAAYVVWMMLFRREKSVLVVATKFKTAANLVKKVKKMFKHVPQWLRIAEIEVNNETSFTLSNGSSIQASTTSSDAGRSEALSLLVIDEAAFVEGLDDMWKAIGPTLSCVVGDTRVLTKDGFKKIEDFHRNKDIGDYFELDGLSVWGKHGMEKVSHGYVSPKNDTLKITTRHGLELEVTHEHPLYKLLKNGASMIKASDLVVGDYLRVDYDMNIFGNNDTVKNIDCEIITNDLAYMIGGYIAEGYIEGKGELYHRVVISNTEQDFRDVFLKNNIIKNFKVKESQPHKVVCNSLKLGNLFKDVGVDKIHKCDLKVIPEKIFECSKEKISSFLSGMFDGDGCVTENGIIYCSTSKKLIQEIQMILLNYGIISNVLKQNREKILERERKSGRLLPQGKPLQDLKDSWHLIIPRGFYSKFAQEIGFRIKRKQDKLVYLSENFKQETGKTEIIPVRIVGETLREIKKNSQKSGRWFREKGVRLDKILDGNLNRNLTLPWLKRFKNVLIENNLLRKEDEQFFNEMLENKCFWDQIVSIEESSNKTYDFTVPGTHSFLQNGILGSNTGGRCIALSCVTKDTFIFTERGIKTIDDFIQKEKRGGYEVEEYSILGKNKLRNGFFFYNNGIVKTKKLFTTNSYLEGSENHKLWSYKEGKYDWHKLEELKKGDYVSVQYGMNIWGDNDDVSDFSPEINNNHKAVFKPKEIDNDLAYVIGLYLAEGSVYENKNEIGELIGGTTTFTCGDDLTKVLSKIGLSVSKSDNVHHCCSSKSFVEFLKYMKLDVKRHATEKEISSRLMEMSKSNISALLRGLFDGDGYSRADRGEVGIGLSSRKMIEQIRILLNNFGILSEYSEYLTPPTNLVKASSIQYRLNLNKKESKKFYDLIGFEFTRKQINENILFDSDLERADSKDIIPDFLNHMKNMFEYYPKGAWSLNRHHGLNINGILNKKTEYKTTNISRQNAIRMFEITREYLPLWYVEELDRIISSDLKWQPIQRIENGEAETYDFSLPNNEEDFWAHSVIYNGLLGHQTPNGVGNWFHKNYVDALDMKNDFHPIKLPWQLHPDRDEEWFEKQQKKYSPRELAQEYECNFNMSGETVIDPKIIEKLKKSIKARGVEKPQFRSGWDRNYWIWEIPQPGSSYMITADVARGDGEDYSAFHVFKLETMEVVAEYQGKPTPEQFAGMLDTVGREYGGALLIVENNNIGYTVCSKLIESEYPNLYHSVKSTHEYIDQVQAEYRSGTITGFTTSSKTRPIIIAKMEEFLRNGAVIVNSTRVVHELERFVWNNGKPEAMKGSNDDLIISFAIGCWVRDTALHKSARDVAYGKAMLNAIIQSNTKMSTAIPGMVGFRKELDMDQVQMKEIKEEHRLWSWLYKG